MELMFNNKGAMLPFDSYAGKLIVDPHHRERIYWIGTTESHHIAIPDMTDMGSVYVFDGLKNAFEGLIRNDGVYHKDGQKVVYCYPSDAMDHYTVPPKEWIAWFDRKDYESITLIGEDDIITKGDRPIHSFYELWAWAAGFKSKAHNNTITTVDDGFKFELLKKATKFEKVNGKPWFYFGAYGSFDYSDLVAIKNDDGLTIEMI